MVRHLPSPPWTMLARTAWVWSWGSRLREASCRKVAATVFWSPARTIRPVSGSFNRVSAALPLDPGQRALDGPVMGLDDAPVAADQRRERDGFGGREGEIAPGPVLQGPIGSPASELPSGAVGRLALQHRLEEVRIDRAGEAEVLRALAGPGARFPVGRVVPGVVAVPLVIGDRPGPRTRRRRSRRPSQPVGPGQRRLRPRRRRRCPRVHPDRPRGLPVARKGRNPGRRNRQPGPRAFPRLPLRPRGIRPGPSLETELGFRSPVHPAAEPDRARIAMLTFVRRIARGRGIGVVRFRNRPRSHRRPNRLAPKALPPWARSVRPPWAS